MSSPYDQVFGKEKKQQNYGANQQYGQQSNSPYNQYQNQQQYGQNQQPYGQYSNQPPYGQNQSPYGQNQSPYGQNHSSYGQNQPPYGQNQSSYGQNQSPYGQYGQNQPPYGQNQNQQQYGQYPNQQQQSYGQNQPPYGQNQQSYGQNQPPYGQNQNQQQYGQYPNQQQQSYGQNQPSYGQNQPPYGQNQNQQQSYGQNQQSYGQYPNQQQQYGQKNNYQQYNQNQQSPQSDKNQQQSYNQPSSQYGQNKQQQYSNQYGQTTAYSQNPNPNTYQNNQNIMNQGAGYMQNQSKPIDQKKVDADAAALRKAMKGLGTDEKAIIQVIGNSTNKERLAMIDSFKRQFNRDLIKDLKSELSGNFENAVIALFQDPITYDCISLKNAMKGLGTNEDTLIEILCTRPNYYINEIKQKYSKMYPNSLEKDLSSDLSGDLKKVMLTLASASRSENQYPDKGACLDKADQLYKAGEKRLGTNEKIFYDILTKASPQELVLIDKLYKESHNHGLLKAIDGEFSGNMKKLLQTIVHCSIDPTEYFATRVNYAIKGLGTKDTLLIRILVTRSEIDLPQIKAAYKRLYNRDMVTDIEKDTSRHYKRLLVQLCSR